jgi:acyl carrier protein
MNSEEHTTLTIATFLLKVKSQFTLLEAFDVLEADTEFKKLKAYDSLTALLIISMIDEDFSVAINGQDMRAVSTIDDLYKLVLSRL